MHPQTLPSQPGPSRFDQTVWAAMSALILLIAALIWWNAQQQNQALSNASPLTSTTSAPAILFARSDGAGLEQLHISSLTRADDNQLQPAGRVRQLTQSEDLIWNYVVHPDGTSLVLAVLTEDGGSDLLQLDMAGGQPTSLMACSPSACNEPSWSPDGLFLGFSQRRGTEQSSGIVSPPRPWMMHLQSGETAALLPDDQELGFDLRWSWDNNWAAYVSPVQGQIGLVNLNDGTRRFFDSGTGEAAAWHPNENRFLFTRMTEAGDAFVTHLHLADIEGQVLDLSGAEQRVEDRNPAWSPDGAWIALRRKVLDGAGATRGSQIWLMRADGSNAVALTADAEADHGAPQWSPDGRYLTYHKTPLRGTDLEPSVWLLDVETHEVQLVSRPGRQPLWAAERLPETNSAANQ